LPTKRIRKFEKEVFIKKGMKINLQNRNQEKKKFCCLKQRKKFISDDIKVKKHLFAEVLFNKFV
jgi:hypothetical protein